jgi:hypothetical protein
VKYSVHIDGKAYLVEAADAIKAREKALKFTGLHDGNFEAIYELKEISDGKNGGSD